jgi:anti-sigma regulatory factor (Ser/Thr protein kinase)
MNFFKFLGAEQKKDETENEPAGKYIPITQIKDSDGLSNFLKDMVPLLHLDQDKSELIYYVMSELGRNVLEHAMTNMGAFFAAEYSKDENTIRIGIADRGIGLRASLMQSHTVKDDMHAIQLALTPGITGATNKEGGTEQNAGAGLFFIKSISSANRNFMVIYSGDSIYKLLKRSGPELILHANPFDDNHTKESGYPYWQGTTVGIDITLDSSVEFTAIMEFIRAAFADAIRERKKLRKYKQPKFI